MNKELSLNDDNYFDIFIGKRILKKNIYNSNGNIPVYSANVFKPFGFLSYTNIGDFNCNYILWGIDGRFEFNIMKKGEVFATTDHCGSIQILEKKILPEYLLYQLELQSHILGFDRALRASDHNMRKVLVKIPVDRNGVIDIFIQKEIVKKYILIKKLKEELRTDINELIKITFDIEQPKNYVTKKVEDIFDLKHTTNHNKFTKEFIHSHKGNIPVYGTSKNPNYVSYGYIEDNLKGIKYFNNIYTWNMDGSVGKAFFRKGRFSLSEKVIPLILKSENENIIDSNYVKYKLEKKAVELGFTYLNKARKSRIKDIEIEFPSIHNKGRIPDIKLQKKLAKKIEDTYKIKENLIQNLESLSEISIEM